MSDPLAHDRISQTTCAHCGGRLLVPVSYCPHCGVNVRQALSERARTKLPDMAIAFASASPAGGTAAVSLGELQRLPRPTLLFESPGHYLDGKVRLPLHSASRFRSVKPNTALTSFAFLILFGASIVLQRRESAAVLERHDALQTVQGSVIAEDASKDDQTVTATQGATIAQNSTPAQGAKTPFNPALPQTPAAPATASSTAVAALPPSQAPHGDQRSRLLSLALARAHDGLDKNDLRKARSGVYWALSLEHDNREALSLKRELLSRERAHNGA